MRSIARSCAAVSTLSLLILVALAPWPSKAQGAAATESTGGRARTIIVTGEGSVDATPDQASLTIGVQAVRPAAQAAQNACNAGINDVINRIMALGIPKERMRTSGVELVPQRAPGTGTGPITGYAASNRVTVVVDNLGMTGRVVDAAVSAGANEVEGPSFGLRDPSAQRTQALRLAVQNAQATATALAAAAGVGPIHLIRIELVEQGGVSRFAAAATPTPVLPGTVTVTVRVRAVYAF